MITLMRSKQRSRVLSTIVLAVLVLASGCARPPSGEDASEPQRIDPLPGSQDNKEAATSNNTTKQTQPDENATEPAGDPPGKRTIEHAMGETTIEGKTERVIALEFNHVENLLALGVQPVGVAEKDGYEKWVGAGELDPSVEDVGTRAEPSLETIAQLEPDLIIAIEFRHEDIYDELSSIAPTLVFQGFPDDNDTDQYERMLSIFERTANATAHDAEGERVVTTLREHFDRVEEHLASKNQTDRDILLSQLFTYNGQPLARVFLDTSIIANVAERIGLENAWTKAGCSTGYGYCDVSKEGFIDVQHADFFYQAQPDDDPVEDEWSDDPVWNSYEFVREDRVYPLGADAWMFGGPLMSQELADRIANHLTG